MSEFAELSFVEAALCLNRSSVLRNLFSQIKRSRLVVYCNGGLLGAGDGIFLNIMLDITIFTFG